MAPCFRIASPLLGLCGTFSGTSSGAAGGVGISAVAAFSRVLDAFLEVGAAVGLVILLELGPKERVFWVRATGFEGLRRVGGMIATDIVVDWVVDGR